MSNDDDETWGQFGPAPAGVSGLGWEASAPAHPFQTPESGRYVREHVLGRGGMGLVLSVLDQRLGRSVALKETRTDSPEAAARLAREAAITARLQHPGIVPVYDAGESEAGRLFYTMRLIEGRSLRDELAERASLGARLPLLRPYLAVCHAVAYAHEQGVLHRDLKPDNLMIGARGEALVVDWGLARMLGEDASIGPLPTGIDHQTRDGAVVGTPGYMSPEQTAGERVSPRSDVWSLGCILYELLSGRPPFEGEAPSILRRVLAGEVPPLDAEAIPGALIAIVERAMSAQPGERYPSVDALADDVARYLDGKLVDAHRYTPIEQLKIVVRQWRAPLAVAAIAVALLVIGAAGAWGRISAERSRALEAEELAVAARVQSDAHLQKALLAQASLAQLSGSRAKAETLAAHALVLGELPRARGVLAASSLQPRPRLLSTNTPADCPWFSLSQDGRVLCFNDDGIVMWGGDPLAVRWRQPLGASSAGFFDNDRYVIADVDGVIDVVIDASDGTIVERVAINSSPSNRMVISPTSSRVVTFSGRDFLQLLPTREGRPSDCPDLIVGLALHGDVTAQTCQGFGALRAPGLDSQPIRSRILADPERYSSVPTAIFSPSGEYLLLGSLEGWLELLRVSPTLETESIALQNVGESAILSLAFTDDEQTIAFTRDDGRAGVWMPQTDLLSMLPSTGARAAAFDGDDLLVLGASLWRWELPPDRRPVAFQSPGGVSAAALSPDGTAVAAALSGFAATAWSLSDGRRRFLASFETRNVMKDVAFSADGGEVIVVGAGELRPQRLDAQTGALLGTLPEPKGGYRRVLVMQDDLVVGMGWRGLIVWQDGTPLRSLTIPNLDLRDGEVTPDGSLAVVAARGGDVFVLSAGPAPQLDRVANLPWLRALELSADGALLAWSESDALFLAPRTDLSEPMRIVRNERTFDLALSPDSRWLAASGFTDVTIYDTQTGGVVAILDGHTERVVSVDFSSDGRMLVTGSWDGVVRLWGTDALERAPQQMLDEIEAAWQMSLSEALSY